MGRDFTRWDERHSAHESLEDILLTHPDFLDFWIQEMGNSENEHAEGSTDNGEKPKRAPVQGVVAGGGAAIAQPLYQEQGLSHPSLDSLELSDLGFRDDKEVAFNAFWNLDQRVWDIVDTDKQLLSGDDDS